MRRNEKVAGQGLNLPRPDKPTNRDPRGGVVPSLRLDKDIAAGKHDRISSHFQSLVRGDRFGPKGK